MTAERSHAATTPLDTAGVLWVAALDRVPIEERVEWVKSMEERVAGINAQRATDQSHAADSRPDLTHYMQAAGRFRDVRVLVNEANDRVRHPIDLNYVAIPKDTWERIVGLVNRV